ncbi:hypothetical protein CERSUDRAFT_117398 [Gelatoporia subvermispora B]|uniref:Pali-domain-containing protein n=1 Tax=Ceriporiopsis subvermispora (strain B) TaxID=914234 RepID=M2PDJ4_CERS8|nr:hypothetical protein CERSUDRAFT_117398 [Gelatoporia subvermispora B]
MCDPALPMYLATLGALVLLVLVTFSEPFISTFYFLRTDASGGVRFGLFGYCFEATGMCTPKSLGYSFDPQLIGSLTTPLVLFPISAGLAAFAAFLLFFIICCHSWWRHPHPTFCLVSTLAFLSSLGGLGVALYLFVTALVRFHKDGFSASLGPSIWLALGATVLLFAVALNAGCGTCLGGRFGRQSRRVAYNY